jgi:hypothetical protein
MADENRISSYLPEWQETAMRGINFECDVKGEENKEKSSAPGFLIRLHPC